MELFSIALIIIIFFIENNSMESIKFVLFNNNIFLWILLIIVIINNIEAINISINAYISKNINNAHLDVINEVNRALPTSFIRSNIKTILLYKYFYLIQGYYMSLYQIEKMKEELYLFL